MSRRKQRDGRFNTQMALEATQNQQTISQNASEYGVNPSSKRIASAIEIPASQPMEETGFCGITSTRCEWTFKIGLRCDDLVSLLYRQFGQLKVELDWLQKKRRASVEQKRQLVEPECRSLSIERLWRSIKYEEVYLTTMTK